MDIGVVIKGSEGKERERETSAPVKVGEVGQLACELRMLSGITVCTGKSDERPRLTKRRTYCKFLFQKSLEKGELKNELSSANYDGEGRESSHQVLSSPVDGNESVTTVPVDVSPHCLCDGWGVRKE